MRPIAAAQLARERIVGDARVAPGGHAWSWVEAFDGRVDVLVCPADGVARPVTLELAATRQGIHGGGAHCWAGEREVVYATVDGRLVVMHLDGDPARVVCDEGRVSAPTVCARSGMVAFVLERDDACDVVTVPLDGSAPARIVSRASFAWDPAWSSDGRRLAWHEWDLPAMPWQASRIACAVDGSAPTIVAGARGDVACAQPRFSPTSNRLAYVTDCDGWANVWIAAPDGTEAVPLLAEAHEHAEPSWGPGQRSYAWSPDGRSIAFNRNEDGFGRLVVAGLAGDVREVSMGWHRGIEWGAGGLVCTRSGARTSPRVTWFPDGGERRVLTVSDAPEPGEWRPPEPEPVHWRDDDGGLVEGLLWRAEDGARSPLVVDVHGGPTDQARADWGTRVRFFASRGWTVLCPNVRGSTGYGRVYARALAGRWGEVDPTDVIAGIRAAAEHRWADTTRVAVVGGSAGAFTALLVGAIAGSMVQAVVSQYGVTDLELLAAATSRFESGYLDDLVGPRAESQARYRERSPVARIALMKAPVLVLQGDEDPVVPLQQAQALVDALRAAGVPVEVHVYAGEGHGWSRAETIADALGRIDAFLRRHVLGDCS